MADLDVEKLRGLLESLGIGKRGLDTPTERTYLQGVMDTANIGYEKTGGTTGGYSASGVAPGVMDTGGIMDDVGKRGMDTPDERDFMQRVMKGEIALTPDIAEKFKFLMMKSGHSEASLAPESAFMQKLKYLSSANMEDRSTAGGYTFDVDGQTEGYTFDSRPTTESIQRMRAIQGITADGLNPAMESTAGGDTEQQFVQKVMADKDRIFKTKMSQLSPQQIQQVNAVMQRLSPEQQQQFIEQVVTGNVPLDGYAIQDEGLPLQNLGFGY